MKKKLKPYNIIRILICVFVLFLIVFPFAWLFLSTFKLQKDIIGPLRFGLRPGQ